MKFLDRDAEMAWFEEMYTHSRKKLFPIAIYGPRRVGKTTLVRNFISGKKALYVYVNETKSSHMLAIEVAKEITEAEGLDELTSLDNWDKLLKYLVEKSRFEIIVFDEFQNFLTVDKSVFGILQDLIDRNENRGCLWVFLGSSTGMIKDVFEDSSAALYGRVKAKLRMAPLAFRDFRKGMAALGYENPRDIAGFYFVFGGYPKYLVALEDFELGVRPLDSILEYFFFQDNAVFQNETRDILRTEFGGKGSQYYAVLEAIATGHTKLSEIASYIGMPATSASTFLNHLSDYYEIIERKRPVLRPASKDTCYAIANPLFRFWFRFVRPNRSNLELGRYDLLKKAVREDFDSYAGREFERLAEEHLRAGIRVKAFDFTEVGGWWHGEREIDIAALGERPCVWECKWAKIDGKRADAIAAGLRENAEAAGIRNAKLGLFAREAEPAAMDMFDYVITLGDMIEGKFPHHKRRTA